MSARSGEQPFVKSPEPAGSEEGEAVARRAPFSRRKLLLGAGAAAAGGCRRPGAESNLLVVWHNWSGVLGPRFEAVGRAFEQAHPGIRLRLIFTRNDLSANQKFFTAVAAGTPPDVAFVDGPQVASWAEWGALEPLGSRLRDAGISPEDYFTPTWKQTSYRDEIWAVTYSADPNFAFAWNRQTFRSVGLDPDVPPRTIDELTRFSDRLTELRRGVLIRMGIIPWAQYGSPNSMFTWGWAFGGDFYDPESRRITASHPRVVEALEWMVSFARKYSPERVQSLQQGFGAAEQDPFYSGVMSLRCMHISGIRDIERYAPGLDYGLGYIPAPPYGEQHSSWVGGWCTAIPRGCRNPELAWKFIRWCCTSPEGTAQVGRIQGVMPGYRRSPFFGEIKANPRMHQFAQILEESRHQRPVMPAQAYYMREMQRAVDAAVYGQMTPREALLRAEKNVQGELDLILTAARGALSPQRGRRV